MINFLRTCAYRVAFRNCCLQHLNQPVKKQSMAFTESEADIFATAVRCATCASTAGYRSPADAQQLVELQ